jgi:tetratricopeptide (TPR) repeat protein
MKTKRIVFILLASWLFSIAWAAEPGDTLFEKAKMLIFDKEWAAALKNLDEVIATNAGGRYYAPALFYRGKCQEELGARKPALESYEKFVAAAPANNLAEEALVSIIELAAGLYQAGEKSYLQKILALLGHKNKVVSYYAAFKLSYVSDRKSAARALPVLQGILDREKDEELRDRAKIAIMRIDPARLKGTEPQNRGAAGKMLRIRVVGKHNPEDKISLSIPLALADLALKSLGAEEKRALKKEGYNVDRLLEQLLNQGMKIDIQDEDSTIQIWIE